MGEYLMDGTKVGTCEDMYYCTYEQAKNTVLRGSNRSPIWNWHQIEGLRFRFPFPQEDTVKVGCHNHHNYALPIPGYHLGESKNHGNVKIKLPLGFGSSSACLFSNIPCPFGKQTECPIKENPTFGDMPCPRPTFRWHKNGITDEIGLCQQKRMHDGQLYIVVVCLACGNKWSLDRENAEAVIQCFRDEAKKRQDDYYTKVADRIKAGYEIMD